MLIQDAPAEGDGDRWASSYLEEIRASDLGMLRESLGCAGGYRQDALESGEVDRGLAHGLGCDRLPELPERDRAFWAARI